MDMLTCSKNWQDKSARFPKSEESEELSKPRLSGEKNAERQGQLKSKQHLHATEQKNRQVPRKWADTLPLNATLFKALSTEELETLKNGIAMELKKMEERKPTSLENKHESEYNDRVWKRYPSRADDRWIRKENCNGGAYSFV